MRIKFSESYYYIRLLSLKAELAAIPNVKVGTHCGRTVVRKYTFNSDGGRSFKTYLLDSAQGQKYGKLADRRAEIKREIKSIESSLGKYFIEKMGNCRVKLTGSYLNEDLWKSVGNDENPKIKQGNYFHNGFRMRSRAEVLVAQILDSLGLDYKYEPRIHFGEYDFYPDFLVYLPGLKRCLIIEFFGMSDSEKYNYDLVGKLTVYSEHNLLLNRDVIGISGNKDSMTASDMIHNNIVLVINLLASEALVYN